MVAPPRTSADGRPLAGVLLSGSGAIALAGGLVWSTIDGWDAAALALVTAGVGSLLVALAVYRRAVFGSARGMAGVNTTLTVVLAVAAFGLVSYLNLTVVRGGLDLTAERRFSLSERSRAILEELAGEVEVTVVLSAAELDDQDLRLEDEIVQLVAQFARAARGRIVHRLLGGAEDESHVLALLEELRLDPRTIECPLVIVRRDRASRQLGAGEFVMRVQGELRFRGEEALLNAILEVTDVKKRRVYFTVGHGEGEIDLHAPGGYTALRDAVERDHLEVELFNPAKVPAVPDDCAALVVLGPRRHFSATESATVDAYLQRGGRVLVLLESALEGGGGQDRLDAVLARWGVRPLPGAVADPTGNLQGNPHWIWIDRYGSHVIVNRLEHFPSIHARPRGLRLIEDLRSPRARALFVFPLLASSEQSWCADDRRQEPRPRAGDPSGAFVLGAAVWEARQPDDRVPEARMVVYGDASFISNRSLGRFDFARQTHLDLFRNALNWLLEREARIALDSRPYLGVRRLTPLDISDRSIRLVMWGGMLGLPLLVLLSGVVVWLRRRR